MPDTAPPRAGLPSALADRLRAVLGAKGLLTDQAAIAAHSADWRNLFPGSALAVLRPATTAECAEAVRLCAEAGIAIVPQAGNTSLVGGSTPLGRGDEVVLSVARMNRILEVDPVGMTMTVEAGAVLAAVQQAAAAADCLFPLSLSSEGSAQIGGLIGTNAGGNTTLRYGNMREQVLGLEVVLADGSVLDLMRRLRKDNTGYALRQLFIGAEGTLGVVTRAVLRLMPRPRDIQAAFVALPSVEAAVGLLNRFQRHDGDSLAAFEYMARFGIELVLRHIPDVKDPLARRHHHYALVELASPRPDADLRGALEAVLGRAMEEGLVLDAAIAESETQRLALWRIREEHAEAQKREGASVKNDVSVPVSAIPELIARGIAAVRRIVPEVRPCPFGHVGDGNIHFNFSRPEDMADEAFLALWEAIADAVNAEVRRLGGSFSAEHGIGRLKTGTLAEWRAGAEIETMRRIKAALDPRGLMNPGKVVPAS
ncbi:FAD-binding oxidoreductase [Elioraea sp. Yellowstone]|jgi:FAD/FMN-containing dehydrogenase|uniref:FAD-binding oxidoreductase n=1 Tax=Elioraea sp. Yellowstone TaxID=2592070 RepID=UPI001151D3FB|nr:FAD-binding oxidoreductase [Elioraea sp. Yellowstone]TQF76880.1 FAD-binding oxidoreductase [Elioraea sp. Yellowstone]